MEIDHRGKLWAASGVRLYVKRQGGFAQVEVGVELAELRTFRWLHRSPDGRLYVAMRGGLLWREEDGAWRRRAASTLQALKCRLP